MDDSGNQLSLSLNLDSTPSHIFKKKNKDSEKITGDRRSRIKQRREIHAQEKAEKERIHEVSQGGKKRKGDDDSSADGNKTHSSNFTRPIKQRKTDGIISSLFKKNPEIPVVESSQVDAVTEEVFAGNTFKELPLHPYLISNLEEKLGFTELTQIQQKAIPILLKRKDALVKSQTGSGKTLAYAVPIIQSLQAFPTKIHRNDGPYALVIVPTRELVLQTFDIFSRLLRTFIWIVPGCLMGGEKKKAEKTRLRKGVNILITTPGRLLDHINSTNNLSLARIHWLVIDEADRLLELGYERDVAQILNALNTQCSQQTTVLLSATLSEGVERLSSITLRDPVRINVGPSDGETPANASSSSFDSSLSITQGESSSDNFSVPSQLNQHFIVTPCKLRLVVLASFLLWKCRYSPKTSKIIVFMSTQDAVQFHWQLFKLVLNKKKISPQPASGGVTIEEGQKRGKPDSSVEDLHLFHLHGDMKQKERTEAFRTFSKASNGILLCTDVAARGLDLPKVDWIIQYTLPGQTVDYIHRIGRTARAGSQGQSLLFLMPSEVDYVKELNKHQLSLSQMESDILLKKLLGHIKDFQPQETDNSTRQLPRTKEEAATFLQDRFEEVLRKDNHLRIIAAKGFQSYIRAYNTYTKEVKAILKARQLHLGHVAKSFALREAPSEVHGLSAKIRAEAHKQRKEEKAKSHRPLSYKQATLSEFSSGLPSSKPRNKT